MGSPIVIAVTGADQAGTADPLTYHYSVYFNGDNTPIFSELLPTSSLTFTPTVDGDYSVAVYATDGDGGQSLTVSASFTVSPSPLSLSIIAPQDGYLGVSGQLRSFLVDANSRDGLYYDISIDWKDGSPIELLRVTSSLDITHRFEYAGQFSPTFTAVDSMKRSVTSTLRPITILQYETQGDKLAVGGSDGRVPNDIIEAKRRR